MKRKHVYGNNVMLTIFALVVMICALVSKITIAYADEAIEYEKSFISIEIENGDTLTSIAKLYAKSETEYDEYISEVMSINNLHNDTIHSGCYLLIPVYTAISEN